MSTVDDPDALKVAVLVATASAAGDGSDLDHAAREIAATVFDRSPQVVDAAPGDADVLVIVGAATGEWGDEVVREAESFAGRMGSERIVLVIDGAPDGDVPIASIAGERLASLFGTQPLWIGLDAARTGNASALVRSLDGERERRHRNRPTPPAPPNPPTDIVGEPTDALPTARPAPSPVPGITTGPPAQPSAPMAIPGPPCTTCGGPNPPGRVFCQRCGASLPASSPPVVEDASPRARSRPWRWIALLVAAVALAGITAAAFVRGDATSPDPSDGDGNGATVALLVALGVLVATVASVGGARILRARTRSTTPPIEPTLSESPTRPHERLAPPVERSLAFVSYASDDDPALVTDLVGWLRTRVEVWFAPTAIDPGAQWLFEISDALETADFYLIVVSKRSMESPWVRQELSAAFRRSVQSGTPRLIPLLAERCDYPILLGNFQMIDATGLSREQTRRRVMAAVA